MLKESTLKFLKALEKNNNREWFEANRSEYETARSDFEHFTEKLIMTLAKLNPMLKDLSPKDCIFRIYRDVRFSKNKDPYKTNFGASIKEGGKRSPKCGFYIQVQPHKGGESFLAGGYWMPDAPLLKKLRQEIEYNYEEFLSIISDKSFRRHFKLMEVHSLKKVPKGFPVNHPAEAYLKYTSFIVSSSLNPTLLSSTKGIKECASAYKAMLPFLQFLNRVND